MYMETDLVILNSYLCLMESYMVITVVHYHVRSGEEDALVALHEDWRRAHDVLPPGLVSGELVRDHADSCAFTAIVRFRDDAAANATAEWFESNGWNQRMRSLCTTMPTVLHGPVVWPEG
jgi:hypothetical protein